MDKLWEQEQKSIAKLRDQQRMEWIEPDSKNPNITCLDWYLGRSGAKFGIEYITNSKEWLKPENYQLYLERTIRIFKDWDCPPKRLSTHHIKVLGALQNELQAQQHMADELTSSAQPGKPKDKQCILWKGEPDKLEKLAQLLRDHDYIDKPSVWLVHFSTNPLARMKAPPIKWRKNKYELQYLLRHLNYCEIREFHPIHFEGLKPPPWSGNKTTHKL